MLVAGQRRMRVGPAAGGDQDLVGGDGAVLALDADRCARSTSTAREWKVVAAGLLDAVAGRSPPGGAISRSLLAISVGQSKLASRHGPAIAGRILEMLGKLRGVDQQLLRHAAADDAGAAEAVFLGDADALAERRPRRALRARRRSRRR